MYSRLAIATSNKKIKKIKDHKHVKHLRSANVTLNRWMAIISIFTKCMNQEATMCDNCNLFFLPCPQPGSDLKS